VLVGDVATSLRAKEASSPPITPPSSPERPRDRVVNSTEEGSDEMRGLDEAEEQLGKRGDRVDERLLERERVRDADKTTSLNIDQAVKEKAVQRR